MPTTAIQIGVPIHLEQNIPYAMPQCMTNGFCELESMDLQVAMFVDTDTLEWLDLIDGDGNFFTAAPFIRCTNADGVTIILRRLG